MTSAGVDFDSYWRRVEQEAALLSGSPVQVEELSIRSNEASVAYGLRFDGIGGHPLFAYFCVPKGEGPFVPLFQAPGYGSVVHVPAFERRERYAVMALCHRGQRLSNSIYKAAYPGLLTDGLPGMGSYIWRKIVADCLVAVDVLRRRPEVDSSRLAVSGNDLAALVAGLRPVSTLLLDGALLFRDGALRASRTEAYPLQEINDFRRAFPDQWPEAEQTLSLYDPIWVAPRIKADTLISCPAADEPMCTELASAIGGNAEVRINTGYSYLDHKANEDWLARSTGVPVGIGPFLPR